MGAWFSYSRTPPGGASGAAVLEPDGNGAGLAAGLIPGGGGGGEGGPPPFATYWKFFTKFPLAVVGKGPILTLRLGGGAVTTKRLVGTGGGEGRGSLADRDCEGGGEAPLGGSSRLLTHLSLTTAAADCS